eukprot:3761813-Amphidinium_carterae.2
MIYLQPLKLTAGLAWLPLIMAAPCAIVLPHRIGLAELAIAYTLCHFSLKVVAQLAEKMP